MGASYVPQCSLPGGALQHVARCSTRTPLSRPLAGAQPSSEWQSRCAGNRAPLSASASGGAHPTALCLAGQHTARGSRDALLSQSAHAGISARLRAPCPHRQPALSTATQTAAATAEGAEPPVAAAAAAAPAASEEPATGPSGVSPPSPAAAAPEAPLREVR